MGFQLILKVPRAPKGLSKDVIKFISNIKKEPDGCLILDLKHLKDLNN